MKAILTLALIASSVSTPVFAVSIAPTPDGGATALLSLIGMGALYFSSKLIKK